MDGVWGPYYSAMVPDLWLNEGGQSATGKLVRAVLVLTTAVKSYNETIKDEEPLLERRGLSLINYPVQFCK